MIADITYNEFIHDDLDIKVVIDKNDYQLITIGRNSYITEMSVDFGAKRSHITIGRYTSIAHRVVAEIGENHDHYKISTYPFRDIYNQIGNDNADVNHYYEKNSYHIIIGNDVWIGEGVRILGGVHIGNGAVIGMGAVVTRDVPPYAVVVGNPARVVRYRFDQDTIQRLEQIRWWDWDDATIVERLPEMDNPDDFVEKYFPEHAGRICRTEFNDLMDSLRTAGKRIFYFVFDCNAPDPLWDKVLFSFEESYQKNKDQILIVSVPKSVSSDMKFAASETILNRFVSECEGIIRVTDEESILLHSDVYVAGNDARVIPYINISEAEGIELRSACDWQSGLFERS